MSGDKGAKNQEKRRRRHYRNVPIKAGGRFDSVEAIRQAIRERHWQAAISESLRQEALAELDDGVAGATQRLTCPNRLE